MKPVIVIAAPSIRAYGYRRLAAGVLIGIALAVAGQTLTAQAPVVDLRMEKACGVWPRYHGEQLTIVVIGTQVYCWNNLHRREQ